MTGDGTLWESLPGGLTLHCGSAAGREIVGAPAGSFSGVTRKAARIQQVTDFTREDIQFNPKPAIELLIF